MAFLSLIFWAFLLGPLGALLAVPATLLIKSLLVDHSPNAGWLAALIDSAPAKREATLRQDAGAAVVEPVSSELPISSPYRSTPDAPVTESEREQVSRRLNAAFTAGGLDPEDYQPRLDTLFAAQKLGELVPVVEGLPPAWTYASPAIVASTGGQPGELSPARDSRAATFAVVAAVAGLVILIAMLLVIVL